VERGKQARLKELEVEEVSDFIGGAAAEANAGRGYPDLCGKRALYGQIASDLNARGLIDGASFLHAAMTPHGMVAKRTTALAETFRTFITDPLL
jgi:hypothetical protein